MPRVLTDPSAPAEAGDRGQLADPESAGPSDVSSDAPIAQQSIRPGVNQVARLGRIWVCALGISFLAIAIVYTMFFGRNKVMRNEAIYEDHRFVGRAGTSQLATSEGYGLTSYGENGLIVNKAPAPGVFRVLFVGDSFVKAKQVSDQKKFTEVVERVWNENHPGKPIQTLNLGLGGQNMPTYLSFGRNMDRCFHPDLVFVMMGRQDFEPLAKTPKQLEMVARGLTEPLTRPEESTEWADWLNWLGLRSFFGQLQAQAYGFLSKSSDIAPEREAESESTSARADAVAVQLGALREIWGDRLVIIYRAPVPNLGQGAPPVYSDRVLLEMERQRIPYINLYQPFLRAFQEREPPAGFDNSILGQGHLNPHGHLLVAEEIIKFMETADGLF
jgi:hypothetical protein